MNVTKNYEVAKEVFAQYGVDTDAVLEKMDEIPVSVHCWEIDDLTGFEDFNAVLTGGLSATGKAEGKPKSKKEYFDNLEKALSLIPGKKKIAVHATYLEDFGKKIPRNEIRPENYAIWVDFARNRQVGLDFNSTCFSHPMAADNLTLSHPDPNVREFWIEHAIACRKVGEYFGREMGQVCVTNHWMPDGYKDMVADKVTPRLRMAESLDKVFAEKIDRKYNIDSLESKLFGLGLESYTVGSHEFYMNYVMSRKNAIICLDAGHFHPTESVAAKIPSFLAFDQELMLHISRGVRWDSDHVVILDDETLAIMQEIARADAFEKVHIGLDFFDASINRVAATAIGGRSAKKSLLMALLEPYEAVVKAEAEGDFTKRLALLERNKMLPYGLVWNMYCERCGVPNDSWLEV